MIFYEMEDIKRKSTNEMMELLKEYLIENQISGINGRIIQNSTTDVIEGVVPLSKKNCNDGILEGESGTLKIIGSRERGQGGPGSYGLNILFYPEITIYDSNERQLKQYKPTTKIEMFSALKEILKSKKDIKINQLEEILRLLCLIEEHTRPPISENRQQ